MDSDSGQNEAAGVMDRLLGAHADTIEIPTVGEIITGTIIDKARNAVYVDLGLLGVGVVYGHDLFDDLDAFRNVKIGDAIAATIERFDNEDDYIELSLRSATRERSWEELRGKLESGEVIETEVLDANKGGLIVRLSGITGFLPVSQLAPDHYPRVEGADRTKIFERLHEYIGMRFRVKVISAVKEAEKLIVSEKAVTSDEMSGVLEKLKVGDTIEGAVSGIVDFGVFIKFLLDEKELEGLIHISELAWQRIDDPLDYVSLGQTVKAKVIGVDGLRISLSLKQLQKDPWQDVMKRYKVGDQVEGEIIKVTPFGGFVRLDADIHGLVHLSELPDEAQADPGVVLTIGQNRKFRIISIEPDEHRLGLSLRQAEKKQEEERAAIGKKTSKSQDKDDKDQDKDKGSAPG
jgi:small subunit ribosomal protein S1